MKLTRSIIATAIITLSAFGSIIYTSCQKDRCAKVTCFNGGGCTNGYCVCPTGYTGNNCETAVTTTIQYFNHSYTPVTITLNNVAYTIPAGNSKGFTGQYGDTLQGNAFTSGIYGETVQWDSLVNTFPVNGTLAVSLDVNPNYYFLLVYNDSSSSLLREFNVNQGLSTEVDFILSPPLTFPTTTLIGYFFAGTNSNVHIVSKGLHQWTFNPLGLTMTINQYYEAVTD